MLHHTIIPWSPERTRRLIDQQPLALAFMHAHELMDDRFRRRKIGLITGANADTAQPLLSPLYYIERAVQP